MDPLFDPREYWASATEEDRAGRDSTAHDILGLESELESYLNRFTLASDDSDEGSIQLGKKQQAVANLR